MPIGARSSVLLIHPRLPAAEALARTLSERGFSTHFVASAAAARVVARSRYYRTIVYVMDLWRGSGIADLAQLRGARPRTWIVVASPNPAPDEHADSLRYLADALLIGPLSTDELVSRLLAFSIRPRPP
jgi:DNA-binding response OmpR family regulator